ncbi:MAG: adenine-specific DNA-methyltransferase [Ignavibacterium sp.]
MANQNKTLTLSDEEKDFFKNQLIKINSKVIANEIKNKIINQDLFEVINFLPNSFIDLLFIDPPYNLTKNFNGNIFSQMSSNQYYDWIESWLVKLIPLLKKNSSIYFCGDWRSSSVIQNVLEKYFIVRNRITWEREKGRGSKNNWKNNTEDIWFCTMSDEYTFNIDAVKLKRKVIAPYKENGKPKDWIQSDVGIHPFGKSRYRITHPSNIWTDITVPFWSMPENTNHPTQKPEKLLAKIILASSNEGDFVFDPFAGVGTTCVVAKKLNRNFCGIELDTTYSCLSLKRLQIAETDKSIQGYFDNIFWERNSLSEIKKLKK